MSDKAILTVDDVMERWGVSRDTVLAHVDNGEHPLPYLPLGNQTGKGKNRTLLRFRIEAVEAWERATERRTLPSVKPADIAPGKKSSPGQPKENHFRLGPVRPAK